jgi:hypothetical protein
MVERAGRRSTIARALTRAMGLAQGAGSPSRRPTPGLTPSRWILPCRGVGSREGPASRRRGRPLRGAGESYGVAAHRRRARLGGGSLPKTAPGPTFPGQHRTGVQDIPDTSDRRKDAVTASRPRSKWAVLGLNPPGNQRVAATKVRTEVRTACAGSPERKLDDMSRVDELRTYADEHLFYEVWMAAALAERMSRQAALFDAGLAERHGPLAKELLDLAGRNADIESFATHVRNLLAFLYPNKPKAGDVTALEYFANSSDWQAVRPSRPKSLMVVNQRVPIEIGHLSFGRARRKDKAWDYRAMWLDLATVLDAFVEHVPPDRVSTEFLGAMRALVSPDQSHDNLRHEMEALKKVVSDITSAGRSPALGATTYPVVAIADTDESMAGTAIELPQREPTPVDHDTNG